MVGAADASMMDGEGASAAPDAICTRETPDCTRTPSRRDDDTTLPRMTGDAGLLMSITTSELEYCPVT